MHKFLRAIGFSNIRKKDLEIIINEISTSGDVSLKKFNVDILKTEYMYKFWGFPIGVSELPKLAASV